MTTYNVGTQQIGVFNALVPKEGPKSVFLPLDFTTVSEVLVDFTQAYEKTVMTVVQTVWCDNSANSVPVSFTVQGTGQTVIVPAGAQATLPVIAAIRPKITVENSGGGILPCIFLNVPLPAVVYGVSGAGATIVYPGINPWPSGLVMEDLTGTSWGTTKAAGGTSTTLVPANPSRQRLIIQNPLSAAAQGIPVAENITININGTLAGSGLDNFAQLAPGQSLIFGPGGADDRSAITWNAATTGHRVFATEYA